MSTMEAIFELRLEVRDLRREVDELRKRLEDGDTPNREPDEDDEMRMVGRLKRAIELMGQFGKGK